MNKKYCKDCGGVTEFSIEIPICCSSCGEKFLGQIQSTAKQTMNLPARVKQKPIPEPEYEEDSDELEDDYYEEERPRRKRKQTLDISALADDIEIPDTTYKGTKVTLDMSGKSVASLPKSDNYVRPKSNLTQKQAIKRFKELATPKRNPTEIA